MTQQHKMGLKKHHVINTIYHEKNNFNYNFNIKHELHSS